MKQALESFRVAATGRWAVSIRSFILTIPYALAINLERENLLNPGNFTHSITICIAGEFASYLYIFIAQATLLRNRRENAQRLSTCAFVWFSTGTVKGISSIIYAVWAYGYETDFLARTFQTTIFSGVAGALLAFYFGTIDRRIIENKALNTLDNFLTVDIGLKITNDIKIRSDAIKVLRESMLPQIEKLENILSGFSHTHAELGSKLTSISRQGEELRNAIEKQAQIIANARADIPKDKGKFREISFLSGLIPQVISVRLTLIVVALGMTAGQMTRNGALGVASGLVGAAVLGVVVFSLRVYSKKLRGRKLTYLITASFPIVFLTQMIYVSNLTRIGFNLANPYLPWYSAMKTIYGYYIACILAGLVIGTSNELKNSEARHKSLKLDIAKLDHKQELLAAHLFATRFGTIQGKVTGATMALNILSDQSIRSSNDEKFEEIMAGASELLSAARAEITQLQKEFRSA